MTRTPTPRPKKTAAPASPTGVDASFVRDIAMLLKETDTAEIEIEKGDLKIRVARYAAAPAAAAPVAVAAPVPSAVIAPPPAAIAAPAAAAAPAPVADNPGAVKSPMVGTAYMRPSPDAKPFVEVGSVVKSGDKILLIEAMKTFNEIVAPRAGTVTAIMVEDGQPVEYGQALLVIE